MIQYIARRIIGSIPTILLLIFVVSLFTRLIPGTAVDAMLVDANTTLGTKEALTERLGLNRSVPEVYIDYLGDIADGSLGRSLYADQPVWPIIKDRAVPTLQLAVMSMIVSAILGIGIGLLSAVKRNSFFDYFARLFVNTSLGVPSFVVATFVVLLPAYYFRWTPPLRYVSIFEDPVDGLLFFIAPVLTLATAIAAAVARLTRTATLEVMNEDYVRTARAKGLQERTVIYRHVLRNSLMPVITLLGIQIAFLLNGSIITEQVFSIPGVGTLLIQKIAERDWPVVQGLTLLAGVIVAAANLAVDILYGYVNPRIRHA